MQGSLHNLAVLSILICLAMAAGCAEMLGNVNALGTRLMRRSPEDMLNIKTPADRIKELKQLAKAAPKKKPEEQQQVVDALAKEFQQESDPILRRHLLRTLAAYPPPAAGAVIVGALSDSDAETRRTACKCLGMRGGQQAISELTRVVSSDTEDNVRIAAVRALGETRDTSALTPLAEALVDPDPALKSKAREALTAVSGRDYGNDVQAWREYAKNGKTDAPEVNIAERIRRSLF